MIPFEWFEGAQQRIGPHIVETPLTRDDKLGLYLKWENHQVTGSFKARGVRNKVLSLDDWGSRPAWWRASAGNHGQGVALAARLTGAAVEVFVPAHAVPSKIEAMRKLGAQDPALFREATARLSSPAGNTWASRIGHSSLPTTMVR